jgi:hypothetical protein
MATVIKEPINIWEFLYGDTNPHIGPILRGERLGHTMGFWTERYTPSGAKRCTNCGQYQITLHAKDIEGKRMLCSNCY